MDEAKSKQWLDFPDGSMGVGDAGDVSLIPESGKSPGGHGNPLQHDCLGNPADRGVWQTIVQKVIKSQM